MLPCRLLGASMLCCRTAMVFQSIQGISALPALSQQHVHTIHRRRNSSGSRRRQQLLRKPDPRRKRLRLLRWSLQTARTGTLWTPCRSSCPLSGKPA